MTYKNRSITTIRKEINIVEVNIKYKEVALTNIREKYLDAQASAEISRDKFHIASSAMDKMRLQHRRLIDEQDAMKKRIDSKPMVSDHALVRYLESQGMDTDKLRREIVGDLGQQIKYMQDGRIDVNDLTYVVANATITTIINNGEK